MKRLAIVLLLLLPGLLAGCSSIGARPWERGQLAQDRMQLIPHGLDQALDDHTYFSKESSFGGISLGGGGCGCN